MRELKTEFATMAMMMDVLGVKVEKVCLDSPRFLTVSGYGFRQHEAYDGLAHNEHRGHAKRGSSR